MKRLACVLLLTSGLTGCFGVPTEGTSMKPAFPWNGQQVTNAKLPVPPPQPEQPATPRSVSAEQVTSSNARQMADALREEMDRGN
ncbi:MAG: hypothetical protein JNM56_04220 [Planctomycetia bacterium]|nr:hypothetical protein [Planctomycetia bacterium]